MLTKHFGKSNLNYLKQNMKIKRDKTGNQLKVRHFISV